MSLHTRWMRTTVAILCLLISIAWGEESEAPEGLNLLTLKEIVVPKKPSWSEDWMSKQVRMILDNLAQVKLKIVKSDAPEIKAGQIYIGKETVLKSGMVNASEFKAMMFDAYLIRAKDNQLALAGANPQGDFYASYNFFRYLGIAFYPFHGVRHTYVYPRKPKTSYGPFTKIDQPFYEFRDIFGHRSFGAFGETMRRFVIGDPELAEDQDWFNRKKNNKDRIFWDHTAAYLVPKIHYYDKHPEYYAMVKGKRVPKSTKSGVLQLCLSNPEVHEISKKRMHTWMDMQNNRSLFVAQDGDKVGTCECPKCRDMDSVFGYATDRHLKWVNSMARAIGEKHPGKKLMCHAYMRYVKPPINVVPEKNVVVLYAPWFFNSRFCSSNMWTDSANTPAMKEFLGWVVKAPGRVGIYDYPREFTYGASERVKFFAKHDVKHIYLNEAKGDLFHWVISQLFWDPFLDAEKLEKDYVEATYVEASKVILEYLRLRKLGEKYFFYQYHRYPGFMDKALGLLDEAVAINAKADDTLRFRTLDFYLINAYRLLSLVHPHKGREKYRVSSEEYQKRFDHYVKTYESYNQLKAKLKIKYRPKPIRGLDKVKSRIAPGLGKGEKNHADVFSQKVPESHVVSFGDEDESILWFGDATAKEFILEPREHKITNPAGVTHAGILLDAPLTRLPKQKHKGRDMTMGRFYYERKFNPMISAGNSFFIDLHLHSTRDVKLLVYVNKLNSQFDVHPGEQVIRLDLRHFSGSRYFDFKKWDGKIHTLAFDIHPQELFYPGPKTNDVQVTVFSMKFTNQDPDPKTLPYQGKAIWVDAMRANVGSGFSVDFTTYNKHFQRTRKKHPSGDKGSKHVGMKNRTFTAHKSMAPIFDIVTSTNPSAILKESALKMSDYLYRMTQVRLPVKTHTGSGGLGLGNSILLGKEVCLDAERIKPADMAYAGKDGFVIHAYEGRIAIAGQSDAGTAYGVVRYLEDHGLRFRTAGKGDHIVPLLKGYLNEYFLIDFPYFKNRPNLGDWRSLSPTTSASKPSKSAPDLQSCLAMAAEIKSLAKTKTDVISKSLLAKINKDALSKYLASRLLWNPFANTTQLLREYQKGVDR